MAVIRARNTDFVERFGGEEIGCLLFRERPLSSRQRCRHHHVAQTTDGVLDGGRLGGRPPRIALVRQQRAADQRQPGCGGRTYRGEASGLLSQAPLRLVRVRR